jgi:hypothetical protein
MVFVKMSVRKELSMAAWEVFCACKPDKRLCCAHAFLVCATVFISFRNGLALLKRNDEGLFELEMRWGLCVWWMWFILPDFSYPGVASYISRG